MFVKGHTNYFLMVYPRLQYYLWGLTAVLYAYNQSLNQFKFSALKFSATIYFSFTTFIFLYSIQKNHTRIFNVKKLLCSSSAFLNYLINKAKHIFNFLMMQRILFQILYKNTSFLNLTIKFIINAYLFVVVTEHNGRSCKKETIGNVLRKLKIIKKPDQGKFELLLSDFVIWLDYWKPFCSAKLNYSYYHLILARTKNFFKYSRAKYLLKWNIARDYKHWRLDKYWIIIKMCFERIGLEWN